MLPRFLDNVFICRKLTVTVSNNDASYMPQRIVVQGGNTFETAVDLKTVRHISNHYLKLFLYLDYHTFVCKWAI